jgi:Phage portal protein, SPP1 Gp6-like
MADYFSSQVRQQADQADRERLERIRRAWEHYDGCAPEPLKVQPGEPDDNVRLVYAQPIVDKGAFYLFGKGGGARPQIDDEKILAELEQAWPGRQLAHLKLATNGGVTGHSWAKLTRTPDGPRVLVLDPSNVTCELGDEDIETAESYCIQWTVVDAYTGNVKARRQRIVPLGAVWEIIDEESAGDDASWTLIARETWAYDWPPIFGAQNRPAPNEYYGRADLEPATLDLIESIEAVVSNANRIARLHGHPLPFATGESASSIQELDVSIGRFLALPDPASRVGQLEMKSDLAAHVALYERMREALREITMLPEVTSGKLENAGSLSGVALAILYGPLIELTEVKRLTYGPMISEMDRRVIELATSTDPGVLGITWPEVAPEDAQAETQALEADQRMKIVSRQTLAEKRGYDWDVEEPRLQDEAAASADAMAKAFAAGSVAGGNGYTDEDDPQ